MESSQQETKPPITQQVSLEYPITQSEGFKEFFGNSRVVDAQGKPKVVFHGSTVSFDKFGNLEEMGDSAGYMGAAYYFTDSTGDVNHNYARIGSDRERRIKLESSVRRRAILENPDEHITRLSQALDISPEVARKRIYLALQKTEGVRWVVEDDLWKLAKVLVESELRQNEGVVYPAYLRMERPAYISRDKGTIFNISQLSQFKELIPVTAKKYDVNPQELVADFVKLTKKTDFTSIWRLIYGLGATQSWTSTRNPRNGREMSGQLIANILQNMKYDGIIIDAYDAFGPSKDIIGFVRKFTKHKEMNVLKDVTHYVVWQPSQIMSPFTRVEKI